MPNVGNKHNSGAVQAAFESARDLLHMLSQRDFIWTGKLPFITDELFEKLLEENRVCKARAVRCGHHLVAAGRSASLEIAKSSELKAFLRDRGINAKSTGVTSYIYYSRPGDRLEAHIDTDNF